MAVRLQPTVIFQTLFYGLSESSKTIKRLMQTLKFPITCFLFTFSIILFAGAQNYQPLNAAAAVVQETVILESDVEERLRQVKRKRPQMEVNDQVRREVLDQLILEKLQLDIANRVRLSPSDAEVEDALSKFKRSLLNEGKSLEDYLKEQQQNEEKLREMIARDITLKKVQEATINQRLRITEREIDEFLQSKAGQEWLMARFQLNHILLPVNKTNEAQQIKLAQEILREATTSKARFSDLARQYSKGPNAGKGGNLGWRTKDQLPKLFYEAVAELDAGDFSAPLRSSAGIHLLEVVNRTGAKPVIVRRYKTRHILVSPSELFTNAEAKAKIDGLYQQLQQGADFIELARKETDDTSSKVSGGDLGWSTPGQFVPEFERTMANTPVGQISEPFRTQFGWHILRVDEVKVEDMFDTVKRNQVANILRQRRFKDELQLWFQELRENAYIEVLI